MEFKKISIGGISYRFEHKNNLIVSSWMLCHMIYMYILYKTITIGRNLDQRILCSQCSSHAVYKSATGMSEPGLQGRAKKGKEERKKPFFFFALLAFTWFLCSLELNDCYTKLFWSRSIAMELLYIIFYVLLCICIYYFIFLLQWTRRHIHGSSSFG